LKLRFWVFQRMKNTAFRWYMKDLSSFAVLSEYLCSVERSFSKSDS
jgi:hypothetical protein